MIFAPLPDPLSIFLAAEVLAIGRFGKPAPLTDPFAGAAAGFFGTILLMVPVAVVGLEKLTATKALRTTTFTIHDWEPQARHERRPRKILPPPKKIKMKKEENL